MPDFNFRKILFNPISTPIIKEESIEDVELSFENSITKSTFIKLNNRWYICFITSDKYDTYELTEFLEYLKEIKSVKYEEMKKEIDYYIRLNKLNEIL